MKSEEIIEIDDDFQDLKEQKSHFKNNFNIENRKNEDEYEYSIPTNSNGIKTKKFTKESQINESETISDNYFLSNSKMDNETDVDPNFRDKKLKKEEEMRRKREIRQFEKRMELQCDNILDFDEIDKSDDTKFNQKGSKNHNYKNSSKLKNDSFGKKKPKDAYGNKNKLNKYYNNEDESKDSESKIIEMKNNKYEKDDVDNKDEEYFQIINSKIYEEKKKLNNNSNDRYNYLDIKYKKESKNNKNNKNKNNINKANSNNMEVSQSGEYNMNFYDTNRITHEDTKKFHGKGSTDIFQDLLPKKAFKKFLKNKIKYYMNEKDVPKSFIKSLILDENISRIQSKTPNSKKCIQIKTYKNNNNDLNSSSNNKTFDYFNYYNDDYLGSKITKKNINNNHKDNKYKSMKNFYKKNSVKNVDDLNNYLNYISHNNLKLIEYNNEQFNLNYDKVIIENKINEEKIKNLKKELNEQKTIMNEKLNKINILENINDNLKQEINKLQENFEYERINNKETKKNYDKIKTNYTDMKNQYDLLNIKYINLSDENYNYKRNKDLYERQIKSKNEMIESLIEHSSSFKRNNINNKLNEINFQTKSSNEIMLDYENKNKNVENKKNKENRKNEENNKKNEKDKKVEERNRNKYDKLTFPELQCKRDELTQERKDLYNIHCKIPLKSTSKELINKRIKIEKRIEEINYDLMVVKLRIKNFKNHK